MNDIVPPIEVNLQITRFCRGFVAVLVAIVVLRPTAADAEPSVQKNVEFARREDHRLLADVYVPDGDGPFPGVLMVHGGAWMSGSKSHLKGHAKRFMNRGYAVVAINYRLAPRHKFPAQIEDCRTALRWMRSNCQDYRIDPSRIAGFGYSAGGQLVCLLGLNKSADEHEHLQAIIAGGAPCEFRGLPIGSKALTYWLGGTRRDVPDVYRNASPTAFVSANAPPVFLFHGASDHVVELASSRSLYQKLKAEGVESHMHVVADSGHLKTFFDETAAEQAVDFLDSTMRTLDSKQVSP